MNLLNRKVLLFFLAFLPHFLNFLSSPSLQIILLGIQVFFIFIAMAICKMKSQKFKFEQKKFRINFQLR